MTNTIAPQVVRIREGDNVIYDLEQCEVHYAAMKRVELPIVYGLIVAGTNQPNRLVEQQLFPHRWKPLLGGCLVGLTSPKTRDGYLCDACQFDYSRWEEEHNASR